jgi:hypothetical protein
MLLPVLALTIFGLIHVFAYLHKRCILGRKKNLNSHAPLLVGVSLTTMYYLYLFLTRSTLDIFNCGPTDPPDGHTYLEVVFERCWQAGGVQMTLFPFALITLGVYVVGYPAFVVAMLWRNKHLVKEDQLLRASGLGNDRLTNPRAYAFRKMFGKLYNNFMPGKWYWILVVITRKALLAFTSLMFRRTPSYQLSVSLLVLFASFVLQVRHVPYMGPRRFEEAIQMHNTKVGDSRVHAEVSKAISQAKKHAAKKAAHGNTGMAGAASRQSRANAAASAAREAATDYNTLETFLLGCAIFVSLAGIMLQSGRFEGGNYREQKLTLTVGVFFIVILSILYILMFSFLELGIGGCCRKKQQVVKGAKADAVVDTTVNPMFAKQDVGAGVGPQHLTAEEATEILETQLQSSVAPSPEVWAKLRIAAHVVAKATQERISSRRDAARQAALADFGPSLGGRRANARPGTKTTFQPQLASSDGGARTQPKRPASSRLSMTNPALSAVAKRGVAGKRSRSRRGSRLLASPRSPPTGRAAAGPAHQAEADAASPPGVTEES